MYTTEIKFSSKELTAREKIMVKDLTDAKKLEDVIGDNESVIITPVDYVVLDVHNDRAKDNKDYTKNVIIDKDGTRYTTGSPSFMESFINIYNEMYAEEEEFQIKCYKRESKNYSGKHFLTCSLI